jgi:hypothetical protein
MRSSDISLLTTRQRAITHSGYTHPFLPFFLLLLSQPRKVTITRRRVSQQDPNQEKKRVKSRDRVSSGYPTRSYTETVLSDVVVDMWATNHGPAK